MLNPCGEIEGTDTDSIEVIGCEADDTPCSRGIVSWEAVNTPSSCPPCLRGEKLKELLHDLVASLCRQRFRHGPLASLCFQHSGNATQ